MQACHKDKSRCVASLGLRSLPGCQSVLHHLQSLFLGSSCSCLVSFFVGPASQQMQSHTYNKSVLVKALEILAAHAGFLVRWKGILPSAQWMDHPMSVHCMLLFKTEQHYLIRLAWGLTGSKKGASLTAAKCQIRLKGSCRSLNPGR